MPNCTLKDLSRTFFADTVVNGSFREDFRPVLQVLEAKPIAREHKNPADRRYRFVLSDGTFSYASCMNQSVISERMHDDRIDDGHPVIQIEYRYCGQPTASGIRPLVIRDYKLVSKEECILGDPVAYGGGAKESSELRPSTSAKHPSHPEHEPRQGPSTPVKVSEPPSYAKPTVVGALSPVKALVLGAPSPSKPVIPGTPSPEKRGIMISSPNVTPIKLISPYVQRWRVCGLVTSKSEVRLVHSQLKGDFKVFNFEVTDEQGSCIRFSAYGELAERFFPMISKGSMYYICGGTIKAARKDFNTTGHDYEITLRSESEVTLCTDRNMISQPKISLHAVQLSQIAAHAKECIDVFAIIEKVHEPQTVIQRSTGQPLDKRDLELIDQSGTIVVLTLWGEEAKAFESRCEHQTIALKGVSVREFNGVYSLSALKTTRLELNLECDETKRLYAWYIEKRPHVRVTGVGRGGRFDGPAGELRLIGVTSGIGPGQVGEKGFSFSVVAAILGLRPDSALYKSCGTNGCKKKVIEVGGHYRCEKCNLNLSSFKYVLLLAVEIADFSGTYWISVFEDQATKLLGKTAEELGNLLDTSRLNEYNEVFNAVRFRPYTFRLHARNEVFNDVERVKWRTNAIDLVDYEKYIGELDKAASVVKKA